MAEPLGQTERQAGQLIYRPPPRWYFWTAVGAALAIHLTAVAVLSATKLLQWTYRLSRRKWWKPCWRRLKRLRRRKTFPIPEPPPPPEIQPEFVEERTPPPKQPQTAQKFVPVKSPGPMSMSRAKALALYAPRPQYPYEARSRHVTGSGVIVCTVDSGSGSVSGCSVSSSTGSPILDNAATSAFRQWRFRPGTVSKVNIPITFTMTGASY